MLLNEPASQLQPATSLLIASENARHTGGFPAFERQEKALSGNAGARRRSRAARRGSFRDVGPLPREWR